MKACVAPDRQAQPTIVRQHAAGGRKVCHVSRRVLNVAQRNPRRPSRAVPEERSAASEQRALLAGGCCTIPASLPYRWTPQGNACRRFSLAISAGLLASTIRPHTSSGCLRLRPRDRHVLGSRSGTAMFPRITSQTCKALTVLASNRG